MSTRIRTLLRVTALAAAFSAVMIGCSLLIETVSMTERAEMFMSDLQGENYTDLADHLVPDHNYRNQVDDPTYWSDIFGEDPGSLTYDNIRSDGATVLVDVGGLGPEFNGTWVFEMAEDEPQVWYINTLYMQGDSANPYIPEG